MCVICNHSIRILSTRRPGEEAAAAAGAVTPVSSRLTLGKIEKAEPAFLRAIVSEPANTESFARGMRRWHTWVSAAAPAEATLASPSSVGGLHST